MWKFPILLVLSFLSASRVYRNQETPSLAPPIKVMGSKLEISAEGAEVVFTMEGVDLLFLGVGRGLHEL